MLPYPHNRQRTLVILTLRRLSRILIPLSRHLASDDTPRVGSSLCCRIYPDSHGIWLPYLVGRAFDSDKDVHQSKHHEFLKLRAMVAVSWPEVSSVHFAPNEEPLSAILQRNLLFAELSSSIASLEISDWRHLWIRSASKRPFVGLEGLRK